jgi:hypothetical protein
MRTGELKQWTDSESVQFFARHLIALCVAYRLDGDDPADAPRFTAYCGTLALIRGRLYFLTAGHILRNLRDAMANQSVNIERASLVDTFGLGRISNIPIPFDLAGASTFFIDEDGLDFGVIALSSYYSRLLSANGSVALDDKYWTKQPQTFEGYALLGLPGESTSERLNGYGDATVCPTMFGVRQSDEHHAESKFPRFAGRLDPQLTIRSVEGMSGGPIFGFRRDESGRLRYWVVALQSAWNSGTRVVYGCPLSVIAKIVSDHISSDD